MAEQYKKPYLESSVFIAWIKGESIPQTDATGKVIGHEERANIANHILSLAEAGQFHVYTSSITITEVHKTKPNGQPEPESKTIDFFRNVFFKVIDVDRTIAESAHRLCRKHGLKPYDAVHLACAVRAGCDALLTWDSDLLKITDGGIGISKPQAYGQAILDLTARPEEVPPIVTTVLEEQLKNTHEVSGGGSSKTTTEEEGVSENSPLSVQRGQASTSEVTESKPAMADASTETGSSPIAIPDDNPNASLEATPASSTRKP